MHAPILIDSKFASNPKKFSSMGHWSYISSITKHEHMCPLLRTYVYLLKVIVGWVCTWKMYTLVFGLIGKKMSIVSSYCCPLSPLQFLR